MPGSQNHRNDLQIRESRCRSAPIGAQAARRTQRQQAIHPCPVGNAQFEYRCRRLTISTTSLQRDGARTLDALHVQRGINGAAADITRPSLV
ncbi:hypothetical protein KCP77_08025 [Salmonella enterica subsp. enterica]|nr:hypothetical protein KCP77_08025 [Salmonella enterica subsp. enterica]